MEMPSIVSGEWLGLKANNDGNGDLCGHVGARRHARGYRELSSSALVLSVDLAHLEGEQRN